MALWRLGRALTSALTNSNESRFLAAVTGPCFHREFTSGKSQLLSETVKVWDAVADGDPNDAVSYADASSQQTQFLYKIQIVTGNYRGAGTPASVFLKLFGSNSESQVFQVAENVGFGRGTVETVTLPVDRELGTVKTVYVQRARIGASETRSGWFLDKVVVRGPTGEQMSFPCKQWLGKSEDGDVQGSLERYLVPSTFTVAGEETLPVQVQVAGMSIPRPDKVGRGMKGFNTKNKGWGGEDAYFYCHGRNGVFGMGIADGVYDWRNKGIDPSKFSQELMDVSYNMVKAGCDDVVRVLCTASRKVESEGVRGSSTCCLLTVNTKQGRLHSANMGDSGFIVIGHRVSRPETHVIFRTPQQEHSFGHPVQLGHHEAADWPKDASLETFQVFPGDVIVMGSDGLFDNLSEGEILQEVKHQPSCGSPSALVQRLTRMAYENSVDRVKKTPYAWAATEAFDMVYNGGKPDDISVVVACLSN